MNKKVKLYFSQAVILAYFDCTLPYYLPLPAPYHQKLLIYICEIFSQVIIITDISSNLRIFISQTLTSLNLVGEESLQICLHLLNFLFIGLIFQAQTPSARSLGFLPSASSSFC